MKNNIRQLMVYLGIGVMAMVFGLGFSVNSVKAETATGTIESQIFDVGGLVGFGIINWTAATTSTSTITIKVRTDTNSNMSGATDWDSCSAVVNGADVSANSCVTDGERYVQYLATFETTYTEVGEFSSAQLQEVTIYYNTMGTLISSPYNTLVTDSVITSIGWNESISGEADVVFQMRTAPDSSGSPGSWSDWMGTSSASDYYTDWEGGETINSAHSDGSNDQWIQYKVFLISDGTNLPVLSDVTISYDSDIPIIGSISPISTTTAVSSLNLTINGSDFEDGAVVTLTTEDQTVTATDVDVASENQITCNLDFSNMPAGRWSVTVTNTNTGTDTLVDGFLIEQSTGTITSEIKDLGSGAEFGAITWSGATTSTSTITMKVRSDSNSNMSGATAWASCNAVSYGADISGGCVTDGHQYLQYQATLTTNYATSSVYTTPELGEVKVLYYTYATSSLISSPYDSEDIHNVLSQLGWTENLAGASDIGLQIRTSPGEEDEPTSWSDWLGPTGTSDYYTDYTGGETINSNHRDGYDDRWIQYKVTLMPDDLDIPIFSSPEITYVTASVAPTVTTSPVSWAGSTVVKANGVVSDSGTGPISVWGFKYGETETDTWEMSENVFQETGGYGLTITSLSPNKTYYIRAFATNARGTSYGDYVQFTTEVNTSVSPIIFKSGVILKENMILR